jgi:hypothetical protein
MRLIPRLVSSGATTVFNLGRVELVIEPEPDPKARDALTLALARLLQDDAPPPVYESAWRRSGIVENAESDFRATG